MAMWAPALVACVLLLWPPALAYTDKDVEWLAHYRKNAERPDKLNIDGHDINAIAHDGSGQTAAMWASLQGKDRLLKRLIELGADLTIPEKDGYTPMHGAGFQGRSAAAKVLIEAGVDVNEVHRDGYSPIFRAAWGSSSGHLATIKAMVEGGADIHMKSPSGSLLDVIMENHNHKMMTQMFKYISSKGHSCDELMSHKHRTQCMILSPNHGSEDHHTEKRKEFVARKEAERKEEL